MDFVVSEGACPTVMGASYGKKVNLNISLFSLICLVVLL